LKIDCAEADAMSPQNASKKSIRLLNLDLLFRKAPAGRAEEAALAKRKSQVGDDCGSSLRCALMFAQKTKASFFQD
jgi:hypothetical protein